MPVIKISAEDLARSVRIKAGWYRATIKECKPEASKDKQSINYNFYVTVKDNGTDREFKHTVNQAVQASFVVPILEAALSTESKPFKVNKDDGKGLEWDTDWVAGKSVNVKFEDEPYQGNLIPKIKVWMPSYYDFENSPF